jgi:hypothetical protein
MGIMTLKKDEEEDGKQERGKKWRKRKGIIRRRIRTMT